MPSIEFESLGKRSMDDGRHDSDTFVTTSFRVRAWWLKTFQGYTMESIHRVPKQNVFGEIYYTKHWVLSRKPGGE